MGNLKAWNFATYAGSSTRPSSFERTMNAGPGRPSGSGGRGRRRRGRRPNNARGHRPAGPSQSRHNQDGIYTAPMDHSYRAALSGNGTTAKARVGALVPALLRPLRLSIPNLYPHCVRIPTRASLPSSTTCSSRPRFKRRRASSTSRLSSPRTTKTWPNGCSRTAKRNHR